VALVVDASVAVGWFVPSQSSALTRAALEAAAESGGVVPAHFAIEVLRALRRSERRGLLLSAEILISVENLEQIGLHVDGANPIERLAAIQRIAKRTALTASDAAYLDVAVRHNIALATRDAALARGASSIGVALFEN
jgi:predicted nucleic acid-binding protein